MSQEANTILIERAREIAESYTGTAVEEAIIFNIEQNDLDRVRQIVKEVEDQWFYEATHGEGAVYPGGNYEH